MNWTQPLEDLIGAGADVNATDTTGRTALMFAAHAERLDHVRLLLRAHANPNAEDPNGNTALSDAAMRHSRSAVEIMRALLLSGATANDATGAYALQEAIFNVNLEGVRLLLASGANPNALVRHSEQTLLMRASQCPDTQPVAELLKAGARVNATDRDGYNALMWASGEKNQDRMLKLLLSNGAKHGSARSTGGQDRSDPCGLERLPRERPRIARRWCQLKALEQKRSNGLDDGGRPRSPRRCGPFAESSVVSFWGCRVTNRT